MKIFSTYAQILFLFFCTQLFGCAVLYHVQLGSIDNRSQYVAVPFEIKMSEIGVDAQRAGKLVDLLSRDKNQSAQKAGNFMAMFQMGPHTGMPVYSTKWTEQVFYKLYEICPSGQITQLTSIRESRNYDAISGEIIKITGNCLKQKI